MKNNKFVGPVCKESEAFILANFYKKNNQSILYIGKALNLKRRVSSYFRCKTRSIKNNQLIDLVFDIEVITTQNETEALLLENNLIS